MSKGERQMLMAGGVALLLYYLFTQKPRWFTALYQTGGEATPTASDDFSGVGGSGFVPTGTDGTGDLITDPNSDVTSDGGGVEESLVRTNRIFSFYDPAYDRKRNKTYLRSGGGGEADSDDLVITDAVYGPSGSRSIAPITVLR
jgi:hypothetical protein